MPSLLGCPEAMAHGDIASYSKKHLSIQSKHVNLMIYLQMYEGIFSQNFLGEDPQTIPPPFMGH